MFMTPWLQTLKNRWFKSRGAKRNLKRTTDQAPIQPKAEDLEPRVVLAAFDLVTVIPNQGLFLNDGAIIHEGPRELTLRFTPGTVIDTSSTSLSGISVVRAGLDGNFGTADDVSVDIGYRGAGENPNEVIVRFADTLPDDNYRIRILGNGATPLRNSFGENFNNNQNRNVHFDLQLGALVEAVVPQPVIRPQTLSVTNAANVADTNTITINYGGQTRVFELNLLPGTAVTAGRIKVDYSVGATGTDIAAALVSAINTANFGLSASNVGANISFAAFDPTLTITASNSTAFSVTSGALTQMLDTVVVYFNQDQLDATSAQNPAYYQLIDAATGVIRLPQTVTYSSVLNTAVLTFAANLPTNTEYQVKVGSSTEGNGTRASAINVGTVFNGNDYASNNYLGDITSSSNNLNDHDLYRFRVNAGGNATITVTPVAGLNTIVRFFDANGNEIAPTTSTLQGAGLPDTYTFNGLTAGVDYYVGVSSSGNAAYNTLDGTGGAGGTGFGGYNLNIQTTAAIVVNDNNSSFGTATGLGLLGSGGQSLLSQIEAQGLFVDMPPLPGGADEPGHRNLPGGAFPQSPEPNHGHGGTGLPGDPSPIAFATFSFPTIYGSDPQGNTLFNAITENQKQRTREIFEIYSYYTGIQFREASSGGYLIVTGDIRAIAPNLDPNAVGGINSGALSIMSSAIDWGQSEYGGGWMGTAFHEIGHGLGLGHSYDIPSMQGAGLPGEGVFPGDNDLVHMKLLYPNNSSDIDMYSFSLDQPGRLTVETVAERLSGTNLLNTLLTLYRDNGDGTRSIVARNDDFYSNDSFLDVVLESGTYYVGVTSTGNSNYDPSVSNTGFGGTTDGTYQLNVNFTPSVASALRDADSEPQAFDGDHDGKAGGDYDFWFKTGTTIFVDKSVTSNLTQTISASSNASVGVPLLVRVADARVFSQYATPFDIIIDDERMTVSAVDTVNNRLSVTARAVGGTIKATHALDALVRPQIADGSLANPFGRIQDAINASVSGSIIRVVGNGGADRNLATLADNQPYMVGLDFSGNPLPDGAKLEVPAGVTLMIDAGALIKMRGANIDAGTSAVENFRNGGAIQVLGSTLQDVFITSLRDDALGSIDDGVNGNPSSSDFGGIVFRADSDSTTNGVYLNRVQHATITYGGGSVSVDSIVGSYDPIHIVSNATDTARPTIAYNTITNSANAAMSANPDSFDDDGSRINGGFYIDPLERRIGPDITGNYLVNNSKNGLFIRIETQFGQPVDKLNNQARFDDTDIVHVIAENLQIAGNAGGSLNGNARLSGRLVVDPGIIVKINGARIETEIGNSQVIAEGTAAYPIRFTSLQDDRFGIGGSFDTSKDGVTTGTAGDWGGFSFRPTSGGSFDYASISYAGGATAIAGGFANFNPIQVVQADLRVSRTLFENNAGGADGGNREGRGSTPSAIIMARGAQPIVVDNEFINNTGTLLSINANALKSDTVPDYGRSRSFIDPNTLVVAADWHYPQYANNHGPLVRLNTMNNNSLNGMEIRPETLVVESIWDDTDIVHILRGEIRIDEHHTYSGLTLQSSATGSLVVKLSGANAGITASGDPLEIDDRIGGTLRVVGFPTYPVVMTALTDDTLGASFMPNGFPHFDTNNDGSATTAQPGSWRSLRLDQYSNDRNVAFVLETEGVFLNDTDLNPTPTKAQYLGVLAPNEVSGDENRRLGFEVQGTIAADASNDVDVYSFQGTGGTEVWLDIDRTDYRLDSMLELVDSTGTVVFARSLNSQNDATLSGTLLGTEGQGPFNLTKDQDLGNDFYTSNHFDAGMRLVLPGTVGALGTYYVRVRSQPTAGNENAVFGGQSSGEYRLQIRLRQVDEKPGSTIRNADLRYATTAIEVLGLPAHSPLLGEAAETSSNNNNFVLNGSQYVGELLSLDRNAIAVSGNLSGSTDVDWFRFTVDYSQIQVISGMSDGGKTFPIVIDVDYADGITRPDMSFGLYNAAGQLLWIARDSDIVDDQPALGQGNDFDDLSRGSAGKLDPYLTIQIPAGVFGTFGDGGQGGQTSPVPPSAAARTYYIAMASNAQTPAAISAYLTGADASALTRLEPVTSVRRIVEDHIGFTGHSEGNSVGSIVAAPATVGPLIDIASEISLAANVRPFTLQDVTLFVTTSGGLNIIDPFTGNREVGYNGYGQVGMGDIDMRSDGTLYAYRSNTGGGASEGILYTLDTGTGALVGGTGDGIAVPTTTPNPQQNDSNTVTALAFNRSGVATYNRLYYAVTSGATSIIYRADPGGGAGHSANALGAIGRATGGGAVTTPTTGMQFFQGGFWGVSSGGQLYQLSAGNSPNAATDPISGDVIVGGSIVDFSAILGVGNGFQGLAEPPQNVENSAYGDLLFAITTTGDLVAIDPYDPNPATALQTIFDSDGDGVADSNLLQTDVTTPTGLAFSPIDYNLWHPTMRRSADAGHGINTAPDNTRNDAFGLTIDGGNNSVGSSERSGGASMYFGLEEWAAGFNSTNYFRYQSGDGQLGETSWNFNTQRDITANANIGNNYNLPGGAKGTLETNSFSLESYRYTDKPTLYFNYYLETQNAEGSYANGAMRDSARVLISVDGGLTWDLIATNNQALSSPLMETSELPAFASTDSADAPDSNQHVQQLYDNTNVWRQARVDLGNYVGSANIKLRFDFSTSGVIRDTGVSLAESPSIDGDNAGNSNNSGSTPGANNAFEGFYIDDIIIGMAERGEMVTAAPTDFTGWVAVPTDPDPQALTQQTSGAYQFEIRRGDEYGGLVNGVMPDIVTFAKDSNERNVTGYSIMIGSAFALSGSTNTVTDGDTITISNGNFTRTFEFDTNGVYVAAANKIRVNVTAGGTLGAAAQALANAINSVVVPNPGWRIIAEAHSAGTNSGQVDLSGPVVSVTSNIAPVGGAVTNLGTESEGAFGNDFPQTGFGGADDPGFNTNVVGNYTWSGFIGDGPMFGGQDADSVLMTMTAGNSVTITINVTAGLPTLPVIGIFDDSGTFTQLAFSTTGTLTFLAPADGTYFFTIGDLDPAATWNYTLDIVTGVPPTPTTIIHSQTQGDKNRFRDQGMVIIESNTVLYTSQDGILIDAAARDPISNLPHPGARMNQVVLNSENEAYGVFVTNNVVARITDGFAGIHLSGDGGAASLGLAPIPVAKVVNNTIYGNGGAAGNSVTDIVFLLDNSGSMGSNLNILRQQLLGFDTEMQNAGIDAQYGLVSFPGEGGFNADPNFEIDITDFVTFTAPGGRFMQLQEFGAIEYGSRAVLEALNAFDPATTFNFRPGASTALVMLTNEDDDTLDDFPVDVTTAINTLVNTGAYYFGIVDMFFAQFDNTFQTYGEMAIQSGGQLFDLDAFINDTTNFFQQFTQTLIGTLGGGSAGSGIKVTNAASPTLLNNIIANTTTGIDIDGTSGTTVVGANYFHNNTGNGTVGSNAILANSSDPLFVNATNNNFYLAPGTSFNPNRAIDSSMNTLGDRSSLTSVTSPLGIPQSPLIAPEFDRFGQKRVDEPDIASFPGIGSNVFKDRGAIERADFLGGEVIAVTPPDNDGTIDLDDDETEIHLDQPVGSPPLTFFSVKLTDEGIGIDDSTVAAASFSLRQFTLADYRTGGTLLTEGVDYIWTYNPNTNEVFFTSASTFPLDARFEIEVQRDAILDFAGNSLQANQPDGTIKFTIVVTDGENDAPVITAPATATVNEDTDLTFTVGAGTAISLFDADAYLTTDRLRLTLSVPVGQGTITLPAGPLANLTIEAGANGTDTITVTGVIPDLNTALAGLRYRGPLDQPVLPNPPGPALVVPMTITVTDDDDLDGEGNYGPPPSPAMTDTHQIDITVVAVNDPPSIDVISNVTIEEDSGLQTVNLAGISEGGGETTQVISITANSSNTTLIPGVAVTYTPDDPTGSLSFTPNPNQFGTSTISVTVRDNGFDGIAGNGDDGITTRTFTVTVTPVNDPPSITAPVNQTVNEDSGLRQLILDLVSAGPFETQNLTFTAVSSNPSLIANPTVIYTQGNSTATLNYTPQLNQYGTTTITLTITDDGATGGNNDNDVVYTFDITVNPVNDPPTLGIISPGTYNLAEDAGPTTINLSGIGVGPANELGAPLDQHILSVTATSNNPTMFPNGTLVVNYTPDNPTGTLTFQPAPNVFGTATVTVTVTDTGGTANGGINTFSRTFTVNVSSINDAPLIDDIPDQNILEDAVQQNITMTGIAGGPFGETAQTLIISAVSSNPSLIPNPTITYTSPQNTGTLSYTPVSNRSGSATITVTLVDNGGTANGGINTRVETFVVNVAAVNDAPTLNVIGTPAAILEDSGMQTINLAGIGAGPLETQNLTVTAVSSNPGLIPHPTVNYTSANATGSLSYTPVANQNGSATITVTVTDDGGTANGGVNFIERTFVVNVTAVNDAPTLDAISDLSIPEDSGLQTVNLAGISAGPANENTQNITVTAVSDRPDLTGAITVNYTPNDPTGTLTFTPVADAFGVAVITVTVTDNGGTANGGVNTFVRTFNVALMDQPDGPQNLTLTPTTTAENRPVNSVVGIFSQDDLDVPNDSFTYTLVGGAGSADNGSFAIVGNELRTAEIFDFETKASYNIRVRVTDSYNLWTEEEFTVTILDVNDAPTLTPLLPSITMTEDDPALTVNLAGIGDGGDAGTQNISVTATSSNPLIIPNPTVNYTPNNPTGSITFAPLPNANGTVTITVTVIDDGGTAGGGINIFVRTFTVTVNPVNDDPTDLSVNPAFVAENSPGGTLVGQLTTTDPDFGDTFGYALVGGVGSTDNAKFQIINDQLFANGPIDFEGQPTYSIRVRSTDSGSLAFEKVLTITATDVNEPQTNITLTPNSVPEASPLGTVVGLLAAIDPDTGDSQTFQLISGVGSTDNALFFISGNQLRTNAIFDLETKSSYNIRVLATDSQSHTIERALTVTISNVNEAPTDIALSANMIAENSAAGTTVGNLSTSDIDTGDTFTYTLVSGTGATDNSLFQIVGNQLQVAGNLNFEAKSNLSIRVRSTDFGGLTVEKVFTVQVVNVNETPTGLLLSKTNVDENLPLNSLVGTLSANDEDAGDTHLYQLVGGVGSTDNASFVIAGNQLRTAQVFDFEVKDNYAIRVRVTDAASNSIEQTFVIIVNNTNDPPVLQLLPNNPGTTTGRKAITVGELSSFVDTDSPSYGNGSLKVWISQGEQTGDLLTIQKDKSSDLQLKLVKGKSVLRLGKLDIATVTGGERGLPLEINFLAGATQDIVTRVMRNVTFRGKPFAAPRILSMQLTDDTGLTSNIGTRQITVT